MERLAIHPAFTHIKERALALAAAHSHYCLLDSHAFSQDPYSRFRWVVAIGGRRHFSASTADMPHLPEQLERFINQKKTWYFGYLSYDLKNQIEDLHSHHPHPTQACDIVFFEPEILLYETAEGLFIEADYPQLFYKILESTPPQDDQRHAKPVTLIPRMSEADYLRRVESILAHIRQGDVYELNFCQEFYAHTLDLDTVSLYRQLSRRNPSPFASLLRTDHLSVLGASPERFLAKRGSLLISQPIKGTIGRGKTEEEDLHLRRLLLQNPKERAENTMIVDLVRNDLHRICLSGTVSVPDYLGLYSFPAVHHLISTITGHLRPELGFAPILRATFPMGSMTGAPKVAAMQLIEQYETARRGIFSGSLGYIAPDGDFDFNVLIRSLIYNSESGYLSCQAGGAITIDSDPAQEYRESLLKAHAIQQMLAAPDS